jgi:3-oxoacyl-[acyl-carrier protein] reductase
VTGFARSKLTATNENIGWDFLSGIDASDQNTWSQINEKLADTDVLINNVGIAHDGLLATQGVDEIKSVIDVNLTSILILTKLYIRQRLATKQPGVIVNVSSIIGIRGYAGLAAYSASKGGLDAMTRALAREMGPKGFRVNSVLPGYFESDLSKSLTEKQKQQIENRTPLGRLATYSDIVPVIRFLSLDDSSFMTGQSIVVDGGITV